LAYSFPFPVLGLAIATLAVVVRPGRMPVFHLFPVHPITSNVLTLIPLSTAISDIDNSRALAPVVHLSLTSGIPW